MLTAYQCEVIAVYTDGAVYHVRCWPWWTSDLQRQRAEAGYTSAYPSNAEPMIRYQVDELAAQTADDYGLEDPVPVVCDQCGEAIE